MLQPKQRMTGVAVLLLVLQFIATAGCEQQQQQQQQQQRQQQQQQQKLSLLYPVVISTLLQHKEQLQHVLRAEIPRWQLRGQRPAAAAAAAAAAAGSRDEPQISDRCSLAYATFLQQLLGLLTGSVTPDLLKVLDSVGKPESGLLEGNFKWLGSRTVCESMQMAVYNSTNTNQFLFNSSGRYCVYSVAQDNSDSIGSSGGDTAAFGGALDQIGAQLSQNLEWGICTPAACNATESEIVNDNTIRTIFGLLGPILQNVPIIGDLVKSLASLKLVVKRCPLTSDEVQADLSDGAVAMIATSAALIGIAGVCTFITALAEWMHWGSSSSRWLQLTKSFSLHSNLTKLFASPPANALYCLNGIRVLSIFWVVLGHTLLLMIGFLENPLVLLDDFRKRWQSVIIINATMSVDSFFMLSGTLVAFLFFKKAGSEWSAGLKVIGNARFWLLFYFHRYWRLTPPLIFFALWYTNLIPYFGNSWVYPTDRKVYDVAFCEKNWWTLLVYLQNFIEPNQACIGHTWYLANDMQMFLMSPILLLILLYGGLAIGSVAVVSVVAISMGITGILNSAYGFKSGSLPSTPGTVDGYFPRASYYEIVYVKPYCRVGAYAIGILLGYVLATKKSVKLHWSAVVTMWLLAPAGGLALLYVVQPQIAGTGGSLTVAQATTYWTVLRPGFALCVAWVVFACVYGYGGPVNALLSWSWWAPLAKLTYCTYIVHMVVQFMLFANIDQQLRLTNAIFILLYLGSLFASFLASICLSMLVEAPLLGLEKLLFGNGEKRARASKHTARTSVGDLEMERGGVDAETKN